MTSPEHQLINEVAHDLRGPLSNIAGFCNELEYSIVQLVAIIDAYQDQLPTDFKQNIGAIIDDDLKPCIKFSNSSINNLNARLDQLEINK